MRGRAGLLAAVLGTALIPGLVAAQEDATPTPTGTATPTETTTPTETATPTETPTWAFPTDPFLPPGGVEAHLEMVPGTPITVTWGDGAGAIYPEGYIVERARAGGQNQPRTYTEVARVVAGPNPSYRDTDTASYGWYCYRIRAISRGAVSDPSTEACVVRPVVDFFPETPGAPNTGSGVAPNDGGQPASSLFAGFGVLLVAGPAGLWASLRRRKQEVFR